MFECKFLIVGLYVHRFRRFLASEKYNRVIKSACGPLPNEGDDEDEQEEMFVDPYESFEHPSKEWGGPRRGGSLPEPTRYGDWERKGRCSDF